MTIEKLLLKSLRSKFKPMTFQSVYVDDNKGESMIAIDFHLTSMLVIACKDGLLENFTISGDSYVPDNLNEIIAYAVDYLFKLGQEALTKQINYLKRKRS